MITSAKVYVKKTERIKNGEALKKNGEIVYSESLWVDIRLNGQRIRKSLNLKNTPKNIKLAELRLLPKMIEKIEEKELQKKNKFKTIPTVKEYMKHSFNLHEGRRSESTIYGHQRNYEKYIKNIFDDKKLDEISSDDITIWQNKLKKEERLAKQTILKIRGLLYTMYEDALKNNLILKNPVRGADMLSETENSKGQRMKLVPFRYDEINTILNSLKGQNKNMIATLFFTGLRAGECIGLKWESIDFKTNSILIERQIRKGEIKKYLKTSKSYRRIPIIKSLVPFLKDQYNRTGDQKSYVFLTEKTNKHFHDSGKLREQIWLKIFKNVDVRYRNLHQTRGTFISTLISNGEDINFVSRIAGHENVKITLEAYSDYIPNPNKNFGECFKNVETFMDTNLAPNEGSVS